MAGSPYASRKNEGFLLGMFSLLDQIMGAQMEDILRDLELDPAVKAALLGEEENLFSDFFQYALVYEMRDRRLWLPDIRLHINSEQVEKLYQSCAREADALFGRTRRP